MNLRKILPAMRDRVKLSFCGLRDRFWALLALVSVDGWGWVFALVCAYLLGFSLGSPQIHYVQPDKKPPCKSCEAAKARQEAVRNKARAAVAHAIHEVGEPVKLVPVPDDIGNRWER